MRKCILSIVALAVFSTAACAGEWSLAEAAKPWKGQSLRLIGESLPPLEALAEVKKEFEDITGVEVIIEQYGQAEVIEKTMADFVGRTAIYDLIISPHRQIGTYVENGWLQEIDSFLVNKDLVDPSFSLSGGESFLDEWYWKEVSWYDNKAYGLPFFFITQYLWYRYDLLDHPEERANFKTQFGYELPSPPVTTDQYMDVAKFFTRKSGDKLAGKVLDRDFYGNTIQAKRHVSAFYLLLDFIYAFGGRDIDANHGYEYGEITINSQNCIDALQYYKDLVPYCPPGVLNYGWDESQAAIQQDIAAMGVEWDDAVGAVENPRESLVAGKIAYTGVPIARDKAIQVEGWSYFIPKSSRKPELAWLFIQWAMGDKQQKEQMMVGGQSAVKKTYEDKEVQALPYVPTGYYLKTRGKNVIGMREVGDPTGWGVPRTYVEAINPKTGDATVNIYSKATFPEQEEIVEAVVLAMSNALSGAKTPKEALDEAAASIKKAIGR